MDALAPTLGVVLFRSTESGAPSMGAIRGPTPTAAECLGGAQRTGSITAGKEADLIVVDLDPLGDIRALRTIRLIVNNGRIAFDNFSK